MNTIYLCHKDCVHYVPEMGTYCGKHTERAVNPHSDDICEDFECGDERLEVLKQAVKIIDYMKQRLEFLTKFPDDKPFYMMGKYARFALQTIKEMEGKE